MIITRFAPSPTGPLHLGHAYSAIVAHDFATHHGGRFLLRIEDLDQSRSRPEWERQIFDDLAWLGLEWDASVVRQSDRSAHYNRALDQLWQASQAYHCTCSRKDIWAASAPQEGGEPLVGPDGVVYPGTCRPMASTLGSHRNPDHALRLNLASAAATQRFTYRDIGPNGVGDGTTVAFTLDHAIATIGDPIIARKGMAAAYHLAVVVDDADQDVTHVVRGADLAEATQVHVILQSLLGLPTPVYFHHPLVRDESGKRLAKRDDSKAIAKYRSEGASPHDIRRLVGL